MSLDLPQPVPSVLGLLDVGTAKIVCLVLMRQPGGGWAVAGLGHQKSHGLKAGVIVDEAAAEDALRATTTQAEAMAGHPLTDVIVAAACGRMTSVHRAVTLDVGGRAITAADAGRLLAAGRHHAERDDRVAVHANCVSATLDGLVLPTPPLGRFADRFSMDVNAVTADRGPLRQLLHLLERCNLTVHALAPSPLASALAVTTAAERDKGTLVIDFGAGTTGVALFKASSLVALHVLSIGGNHLTFDMTRALGVPLEEAERIKKKCAIIGSAHSPPTATAAMIAVRRHGEDHAMTPQVTGADMSACLTSRIAALMALIQQRLDQIGTPAHLYNEAVLTGGGSQLCGLASLVESLLGLPARVAVPVPSTLIPPALSHAAFATAAGLAALIGDRDLGLRFPAAPTPSVPHSAPTAWHRPGLQNSNRTA